MQIRKSLYQISQQQGIESKTLYRIADKLFGRHEGDFSHVQEQKLLKYYNTNVCISPKNTLLSCTGQVQSTIQDNNDNIAKKYHTVNVMLENLAETSHVDARILETIAVRLFGKVPSELSWYHTYKMRMEYTKHKAEYQSWLSSWEAEHFRGLEEAMDKDAATALILTVDRLFACKLPNWEEVPQRLKLLKDFVLKMQRKGRQHHEENERIYKQTAKEFNEWLDEQLMLDSDIYNEKLERDVKLIEGTVDPKQKTLKEVVDEDF